jgi:hypothetical protein
MTESVIAGFLLRPPHAHLSLSKPSSAFCGRPHCVGVACIKADQPVESALRVGSDQMRSDGKVDRSFLFNASGGKAVVFVLRPYLDHDAGRRRCGKAPTRS